MESEHITQAIRTLWDENHKDPWPEWDNLSPNTRKLVTIVGKELYDAGFQAGADSVEREPMTNQEMVAEFSRATGGANRGWKEWVELRKNLLIEECREVCYALDELHTTNEPPLEAFERLMKELADVLVIAYGTALRIGNLDLAFHLVHESNMSKIGPDGQFDVRDDGKVLKGPNYHPPVMASTTYWS